jgi:hypothetical protein
VAGERGNLCQFAIENEVSFALSFALGSPAWDFRSWGPPTPHGPRSVGTSVARYKQMGMSGGVVAKRSRRSMVRGSAMTSSPSNKIHDPTCRAENPANRKNFQSSRAPHTKGCNTVFVRPTAPKLLLKSRDPGATHLWACVPNLWRLLGSGQKSHSRSAVT